MPSTAPANSTGFLLRSTVGLIVLLLVIATMQRSVEAREPDAPLTSLGGKTMGTTYSVRYSVTPSIDRSKLSAAIDARLAEIDERMSTYREDSELSRFNQSAAQTWFDVSAETAKVAQLALDISAETDGAFDPTVGPLVELWRFGRRRREPDFAPPSDSQIQATLARVGYQKLQVRLDPPALWKEVEGLELDLSAIAKGYGVDQIAELVRAAGAERLMVEIGGEVRAIGGKTSVDPWRIGIEAPVVDRREVEVVAELQDRSMATSGNYRNSFQHEGVLYSHTIDPRTGRPSQFDLGSVTILADSCARADALATAVLVLGPIKGPAWTKQQQVTALFLNQTEGGVKRQHTGGFPTANGASGPALATAAPAAQPTTNYLTILVLTGLVFGIALAGMAIGVIVSNRRIQGSCGGLAGMKDANGQTLCQACRNPSPECSGIEQAAASEEEPTAPKA